MFYGRICFSGVHTFQDYMSYEQICPNGGNDLLEKMSYGRSCIGGVHVFRMTCLTICCVWLEDMSYWRVCFS